MRNRIIKIFSLFFILLTALTLSGCDANYVEYDIHTSLQNNFLSDDYKMISLYADGSKELSKPNAITISWNNENVSGYDFYLSENKSFNEYRIYKVETNQVELVNLKINTVYYWYIEYLVDNVTVKSDVECFKTRSVTPRNLDIEGVTNARDLGGYKIGKSSYSNQGLIYRTARFNESDGTVSISEKGIKEMVEVLKIKTELDVRKTSDGENGGITSSVLGDSVKYCSVPMKSGGNYLLLNKMVLKDVFAVFGNEDNYPIVIHCSIGTDRTGVICFLINALLGVSEEDLYKDYLFSMFGEINNVRNASTIDDYINKVSAAEGDTLKEKTYNYLVDLGVSESDLNNLIRIMTK